MWPFLISAVAVVEYRQLSAFIQQLSRAAAASKAPLRENLSSVTADVIRNGNPPYSEFLRVQLQLAVAAIRNGGPPRLAGKPAGVPIPVIS